MRLPVLFLMITVAIDAMGIGLILPVMPDLIQEVSGDSLSRAALWGGVLSSVFAIMQFLCAPFLGHLSDIYGRRPVLLGTLAIVVVDYAILGFAGTLALLIVARALGGAASATQSTAHAAMADLSTPEKRAQGFGLIGAAFGLGFVLGPVLGGILGEFGTRAPFWAACALCALNWVFGLIAFPETSGGKAATFRLSRANPFGAFHAMTRLGGITRALAITFLYHLSFAVYPVIWAFFGKAQFGWNSTMVGVSLGIFGLSAAVIQAGLIGVLVRHLGERGTALFGLTFQALAFVMVSIVQSGMVALCLVPFAAMGAAFGPAMSAMLSHRVGPDRQGELQGVLSATASIAMVLSPLLMTNAFSYFTDPARITPFPAAPFLVSLVLTLGALVLLSLGKGRRIGRA